MMKRCTLCKKLKSQKDYYPRNGKCKECYIEIRKDRHKTWKNNNKDRVRQHYKNRENRIREQVNKLKTKHCIDCDKTYPYYCMEFDHTRDKTKCISTMVEQRYSFKSILKEVEKCELVCVLCHRNRTYFRAQLNKRTNRQTNKFIVQLKNKSCVYCKQKYNPWQMDFDHRGDKNKNIAHMIGYSVKKIMEEVKKCSVVCALCHRKKTFEQQSEGNDIL